MITLKNKIHWTEIQIRKKAIFPAHISDSTYRKVIKKLCPNFKNCIDCHIVEDDDFILTTTYYVDSGQAVITTIEDNKNRINDKSFDLEE